MFIAVANILGGLMYDLNDKQNLALMGYKEARGQGNAGMQAVMSVAVNRVGKDGFGRSLHDVIYGKNQFTSMSVPSDPEYNLQPEGEAWIVAQILAGQILDGTLRDSTAGACYYANPKYTTSGWFVDNIAGPDWHGTPLHPFTIQIGAHKFFV